MELGQRIEDLRNRHGWTRAQLARASGVAYNTIKRLEEGTHKSVRIFDGEKLARAFGITMDELLRGVRPPDQDRIRETCCK